MAGSLWFGNSERVELVKCALQGWDVANDGYAEILNYINGGSGVVRSFASARTYDLSWAGTPEELNPIKAFQQGVWGPGPFRIADPITFRTNVLPPNWAAPRLIEVGDWKNIYTTDPIFSATAANSYGQPARTATWSVTSVVDAVPGQVLTVLIPPSHTLHVGASGSKTGDAVLRVRPINSDGSYSATTDLTLLNATASTRMNASFSGATYRAVEIYITRTAATTSTISITSMQAQLWKTAASPTLTGSFIPGDGVMGLEFASGMQETYVHDQTGNIPARKSASVALVEVEPWL